MKWIVCNSDLTKGIVIEAKDCDTARHLATENYYSPFDRKKDLTIAQVYEPERHLFVSATGNKKFGFVQFHIMGGVTTSYDTTIDTPISASQHEFLRNEPIEYIKFYMTRKDAY